MLLIDHCEDWMNDMENPIEICTAASGGMQQNVATTATM